MIMQFDEKAIIFCRLLIVLLLIVILLAGCTSSQSTATEAVPTLASPSEEPTPMSTPKLNLSPPRSHPPLNPPRTGSPIPLVNPGFEEQAADGTLAGWTHSGACDAILIEDNGHSSDFRLTHNSTRGLPGRNLPDHHRVGEWTVYAARLGALQRRARRSLPGAQVRGRGKASLCAADHTGLPLAAAGGLQPGNGWQLHHPPGIGWLRRIPGPALTISSWCPGGTALSILGADISSLKKSEDMGGVYRYPDGTQADALQILSDYGMNYARLRVWVDPAGWLPWPARAAGDGACG